MSTPINIQAAKTHLSRLVEQAASGEEVIIAKAGKPMVKLVPYKATRKPRTPGLLAGQGYWESPDCWEPDEELIKQMTESPIYPEAPDLPAQHVAEDKP